MIFLSYSRQQLYFAESLVLALQKYDVDLWFDLQQLYPGCNWQEEISRGLAQCDQLILVVSKAAMQSPYVELEWRAAVEAGKTITLVIYEASDIPPELQDAPVFDFRRKFDAHIRPLLAHLRGESVQLDQAPKKSFLPVPLTVPFPILVTLFVMFSITGIMLFAANFFYDVFPQVPEFTVLIIAIGLYVGFIAIQFWRHQSSYGTMRAAIFVPGGVTAVLAAILFLFTLVALPNMFGSVDQQTLIEVSLTLILSGLYAASFFTFYYRLIRRSAKLLRWFPAGGAPQRLRRLVNGDLMHRVKAKTDEKSSSQKVQIQILEEGHYDSLVKDIEQGFSGTGVRISNVESDDTDFYIVVITAQSSIDQINDWNQRYGDRVIYLISSPIDMPDELSHISKNQWVDYRKRDHATLISLAQSLRSRNNIDYALETVPERMNSLNTPGRLNLLMLFTRNSATMMMALGILSPFIPQISFWTALPDLIIGALALWAVSAFIQQHIEIKVFIGIFILMSVVSALVNLSINPQTIITALIGSGMIIGLVGYCYPMLKTWLPDQTTVRPSETSLIPNHTARVWLINILWFVGAIAIQSLSFRLVDNIP